ncbi:transcription termination/antitermination NusG family protein [Marinobacter sp. F4218]|uniref:transcription termination/antitermination NusG family protein n=1 Tax=Marinobacter sp. F4218 TaxID=2862868 RepID=UPI002B45A08A|nr:transcription termination/antitermination NusG family protein [Marinobacter sp. F4218]
MSEESFPLTPELPPPTKQTCQDVVRHSTKLVRGDRAHQLQNQDIPCFFPKIEVEKIKAGKRTKKRESLFSSYLFVNLEQPVLEFSRGS